MDRGRHFKRIQRFHRIQNQTINIIFNLAPKLSVSIQEIGCPDWTPSYKNASDIGNSSKILIPILPYGPNNQLRGFRETLFLGEKLDRLVVPPPFFKHFRTDSTDHGFASSMVIEPNHRIDIDLMSENFQIIPPKVLSNFCNAHFDVFFKSKRFYCNGKNLKQFEFFLNYLNMTFEKSNILDKSGRKSCKLDHTLPGLGSDTIYNKSF